MTGRRGFLGTLAALVAAPLVPKTTPVLAAATEASATTFTVPAWVTAETALRFASSRVSLYSPGAFEPGNVGSGHLVHIKLPEVLR